MGLPDREVYCINTLKVNMISQACRVRGFVSMLQGMCGASVVPYATRCTLTPSRLGADAPSWIPQYLYGTTQNTVRIRIAEAFVGMSFKDAAVSIHKQHHVLLFALQRGDVRQLFPANEHLATGDLVFVLSSADAQNAMEVIQSKDEGGPTPAIEKRLTVAANFDYPAKCAYPTNKEERQRDMHIGGGKVIDYGPAPKQIVQASDHILNMLNLPQFAGARAAAAAASGANQSDDTAEQELEQQREEEEEEASRIKKKNDEAPTSLQSPGGWFRGPAVGETVLTSVDEQDVMMKLGRKMAKKGDHILLCGITKDFWDVALSFMRPLRSRCIKPHRRVPVIVISQTQLPHGFFDEYDDVVAIQQDPCELNTLINFGLDTASRIVVLAGTDNSSGDKSLIDGKILMISNSVESYLRYTGTQPYSEEKCCIYEISDDENLKLLPAIPIDDDIIEPHESISAITDVGWRAVSGSLVDTNNLAVIFARAFYTPGIMEVFEAIVSPSKSSAPVCL